jgi:hypothetical protein
LALIVFVTAFGTASASDAAKTLEVVAKVVAVDLEAKLIRTDDGAGHTRSLLVVGKPAETLDQLPIGRMFKLTLRNSDDGTRQEVIAIKVAKHIPES